MVRKEVIVVVFSSTLNQILETNFIIYISYFKKKGFEVFEIRLHDNELSSAESRLDFQDQMNNILKEYSIHFILVPNMQVLYAIHRNSLHVQSRLVVFLDTPYNKVKILKSLDENVVICTCDSSFIEVYRKINPKIKMEYLPAASILKESTDLSLKIEARPIDVLFVGRLGFDKVDFTHKSKLERWYAPRIVKKAFIPGNLQIHEFAMNQFRFFHKSGLSNVDFYSENFMDYCWRLAHKVRSDRRVFALEELFNLDSSIKQCFITDSFQYFKQRIRDNHIIKDFMPWDEVVGVMGQSKIVVNIQPFHIQGLHERLLTAMAVGAVVISDRNPMLEKRFTHEKNILFFDYKKGNLMNIIKKMLKQPALLQSIADDGYHEVMKNDQICHRAQTLIEMMNSK